MIRIRVHSMDLPRAGPREAIALSVTLATAALLCAMSVLLYIDVRMRTEGIDIERRIEMLPHIREETE